MGAKPTHSILHNRLLMKVKESPENHAKLPASRSCNELPVLKLGSSNEKHSLTFPILNLDATGNWETASKKPWNGSEKPWLAKKPWGPLSTSWEVSRNPWDVPNNSWDVASVRHCDENSVTAPPSVSDSPKPRAKSTRPDLVPNSLPESTESLTCNNTPNPFDGFRSEPLRPPRPRSPFRPAMRRVPSIFQDQFTQFMEDRMVQFRPSSSQNNVESALYGDHPYQVPENSLNCAQMRTWNRGELPLTPNVRNLNEHENLNESNSSFLPRGVEGPTFSEPARPAMAYTPQAVPFEAAKMALPMMRGSGCVCVPWSL